MKTYDLMLKEFERLGGNEDILKNLWLPPYAPFLAWLVPKVTDPKNKGVDNINTFCTLVDNEFKPHRIVYAMYRCKVTPLHYLQKHPEYSKIREILDTYCGAPKLWDDIMPYAYHRVFDLCVRILHHIERMPPRDIACVLHSKSYSHIYKILYRAPYDY